ncbi:hypothetical protein D1007_57791 [Hordeum vulgare]|nr:hypothetical protein D1007_57791 [Hordeum vulgare]
MVSSLGSIIGKTMKVDMPFTRTHGIASLLVNVLHLDYVPHEVPWAYDGVVYDLEVDIEDHPYVEDNLVITDVDMTEGGGGNSDQELEEPRAAGCNMSHPAG